MSAVLMEGQQISSPTEEKPCAAQKKIGDFFALSSPTPKMTEKRKNLLDYFNKSPKVESKKEVGEKACNKNGQSPKTGADKVKSVIVCESEDCECQEIGKHGPKDQYGSLCAKVFDVPCVVDITGNGEENEEIKKTKGQTPGKKKTKNKTTNNKSGKSIVVQGGDDSKNSKVNGTDSKIIDKTSEGKGKHNGRLTLNKQVRKREENHVEQGVEITKSSEIPKETNDRTDLKSNQQSSTMECAEPEPIDDSVLQLSFGATPGDEASDCAVSASSESTSNVISYEDFLKASSQTTSREGSPKKKTAVQVNGEVLPSRKRKRKISQDDCLPTVEIHQNYKEKLNKEELDGADVFETPGKKESGSTDKFKENGETKEDIHTSTPMVNSKSAKPDDTITKDDAKSDQSNAPAKNGGLFKYFQKSSKNDKKKSQSSSSVITFEADIHDEPSPGRSTPHYSVKSVDRPSPPVRSKPSPFDDDLTITHIETIEVPVKEKKRKKPKMALNFDDDSVGSENVTPSQSNPDDIKFEQDADKASETPVCVDITKEMDVSVENEIPRDEIYGHEEAAATIKLNKPQKMQKQTEKVRAKDSSAVEKASAENSQESKDSAIQEEKRKRVADQISAMSKMKVEVPSKTSQATLRFGRKGQLKVKSHTTRQRKKQKGKSNADKELAKDAENVESSRTRRRSKRRLSSPEKAEGFVEEEFVARIVSPDEKTSPSSTPIRMKFNRVVKVSSDDEEMFTPKSKKSKSLVKKGTRLKTAQKLLQKAKQPKKRASPVEVKKELISPVRRSSRNSAKVAAQAISICLDTSVKPKNKPKEAFPVKKEEVKTPKKASKKTPKKTPAVKTPKKTPQKPKKDVKMAPIFMKGKKQNNSDSGSDDVIVTKVETEEQRVRRQFLLSSIPEEMRKQMAAPEVQVLSDYPTLPTVSHVQQLADNTAPSGGMDWNLKNLKLHTDCNLTLPDVSTAAKSLRSVLDISKMEIKRVCKDFNGHKELLPEVARALVEEVASFNSNYPVRRMYKLLSQAASRENSTGTGESAKSKAEGEDSQAKQDNNKGNTEKDSVKSPTRRSKRNKRGRSSDVTAAENDSTKTSEQQEKNKDSQQREKETIVDLMWTEKYQPMSSQGIVGNSRTVKKIRGWLQEWKHRADAEARRLQRELLKQAKKEKQGAKKPGPGGWEDDDDDEFCGFSSDDSDEYEEDDGMCNTMLVTGPHGIGKTALVYALAQELGYKVFEVNASSKRAGKNILLQLQEATQSHQVAKKNIDAMYTSLMSSAATKQPKAEVNKATPKPVPAAFANFFSKKTQESKADPSPQMKNKKENTTQKKTSKKQEREQKDRKRKGNKSENSDDLKLPQGSTSAGKALTDSKVPISISLILFEEVDVIFEEDKGFLAAIQTFMGTTKRPIILTTSDPHFTQTFEGRCEEAKMKIPPLVNIASHLQVMCLVENIRTDHHEMLSLVQQHKGDIRKLVLMLQHWAASGGSCQTVSRPVKLPLKPEKPAASQNSIVEAPQPPAVTAGSDDDFVSQPRTKRRRVAMVLDDESSKDSLIGSQDCEAVPLAEPAPEAVAGAPDVHIGLLASTVGVGHLVAGGGITQSLKTYSQGNQGNRLAHLTFDMMNSGIDLLGCNLPKCLLLPTEITSVWRYPGSNSIRKQTNIDVDFNKPLRRIMMRSDLFDSDNSSDCFNSSQESNKGQDSGSVVTEESTNRVSSDPISDSGESNVKIKKNYTEPEKHGAEALVAMSQLCENFSIADCLTLPYSYTKEGPCSSDHNWSSGTIVPGLSDSCKETADFYRTRVSISTDVTATIQALSVIKANAELHGVETNCSSEDEEEIESLLSLPVEDGDAETVKLFGERRDMQSLSNVVRKCVENISGSLPTHLSQAPIAMDYLPTLRLIAKAEQLRQACKAKRRFFHYLDSIQLPIKQSAIDALCSSFT